MAKVKFQWTFKIDMAERDLEIWLNDGVNCIIDIDHENYHMHLSNKLTEILYHEHVYGTKTCISKFENLEEANAMHVKGK